ncbi:MAG: hypothetical protein ACEPOZ_10385 [Marinifilaceae bacterium]
MARPAAFVDLEAVDSFLFRINKLSVAVFYSLGQMSRSDHLFYLNGYFEFLLGS